MLIKLSEQLFDVEQQTRRMWTELAQLALHDQLSTDPHVRAPDCVTETFDIIYSFVAVVTAPSHPHMSDYITQLQICNGTHS